MGAPRRAGVAVLRLAFLRDFDDFLHQGVHDFLFLYLADDLAATHEQSHAHAAGDAHIGVARLARAIDLAAHDSDAQRYAKLERLHLLFDRRGERDQIDIATPARRTGNDLGTELAQPDRREDAI